VARYLSEEWFGEVGGALAETRPDVAAPPSVQLVLQQVVTGTPDGDVAYTLHIDDGRVSVHTGHDPHADVTITEDYATAVALHRGDVTLQEAFMEGRVKVAGNISALLAHHDMLATVDPLPAGTRAATTY